MIADDTVLTKIVVAWTNTPVARVKRLAPLKGKSENAAWEWLWHNTRYSEEDFISRIPAAGSKVAHKIRALIGNRVLYPDGTVNSYVDLGAQPCLSSVLLALYAGRTSGRCAQDAKRLIQPAANQIGVPGGTRTVGC